MSEVGKPHHRGAVTRSSSTSNTGSVAKAGASHHQGATTAKKQAPRKPVTEPSAGASQSHIKTKSKLNSWLRHHRMMALDSLWRVLKAPIASLMTWAVLAIAIALPTGLYLFLSNAQLVTSNWDGASQMSLFLKMNVTEQKAEKLADELRERGDIAAVQYISKQQALNEFKEFSGFGGALDYLDGNPLPSVLIVRPAALAGNIQQQEQLLRSLQALPEVDEAQLDLAWVKRLYYIMELSQRMVSALAVLLGIAVLLVVGNTIRLAIENRRDEIVVVKLVGGTDAFVRRPFLYTGIWYGLGGGIMAWGIINISLFWLDGPVKALASVYASSFELVGLNSGDSLVLILSGAILGWLGAWLAVGRHLGDIEPR
ncbi:cell division protein FtsX [Oceanospirillum multiglobuliferum]|uniref:permease-like cell division protein FtsX n=1 Tax=Oceanospirillum multiglobuliferum TaxID=64969 RepID=UPI000999E722|nr:permease-like cell division protein FtsX [Oceanospirillum multiglobuliferum]SJZ80530.1 cell division protein FtsX [Oceanospirillum multiglobuliferum]